MKPREYFWFVGLALVITCVVPLGVRVYQVFAYAHEQRAAQRAIDQLCVRRPMGVNADTWEFASDWANTAYCNICFSPEHVSHDELRRFRADLEDRLRRPIDLGTIDWVWNRLGKTGPHGRSYQRRFEPQYREGLEVMRLRR